MRRSMPPFCEANSKSLMNSQLVTKRCSLRSNDGRFHSIQPTTITWNEKSITQKLTAPQPHFMNTYSQFETGCICSVCAREEQLNLPSMHQKVPFLFITLFSTVKCDSTHHIAWNDSNYAFLAKTISMMVVFLLMNKLRRGRDWCSRSL